MKHMLVSGLVNTETTVKVRQFPIPYYPIDYPFFGVNTAVSGVAYNIAGALTALGDKVSLCSMTGRDFPAEYIGSQLRELGISTANIRPCLQATASSVVLYDEAGRRQIYCDLKDIQEAVYGFEGLTFEEYDMVAACNINFNRPLLAMAKAAGKKIATDVHILSDVYDGYNQDFLQAADLLFLSDEGIGEDYEGFLWELARVYGNEIIVLGRGGKGAAMYVREYEQVVTLPAVNVGPVVNTVGAGDALFSSFLHYYAAGRAPLDCLRRAQCFAAAKIRVSGASKGFVPEEEVENWIALLE